MRYDQNHKDRTRARVLTEAAAAIRSKGVERVGVADVMGGAGLTHGGFYAHFKSKDELVAHAVTHMFDASYAWFLRHTVGASPRMRSRTTSMPISRPRSATIVPTDVRSPYFRAICPTCPSWRALASRTAPSDWLPLWRSS